ncbi:MAG: hypothetical protein KA807_12340 [Prolixibacteraceae bacterium]|nr:hypothetical protein [Prolixibacteraceae bacterium]
MNNIDYDTIKKLSYEASKASKHVTFKKLYYHMVRVGLIENSFENSKMLYDIVVAAALKKEYWVEDIIDWGMHMHLSYDPVIIMGPSVKDYLFTSLENCCLQAPPLDIWKTQDFKVEILVENPVLTEYIKLVLEWHLQITADCALDYLDPARVSVMWDFYGETNKNGKPKKYVVLYVGNLNYSGWKLYNRIRANLEDKVHKISWVCLNPDQVDGLIKQPLDKNGEDYLHFDEFRKTFNVDGCYELDSMKSDDLNKILTNEIDKYYDYDLYPSDQQLEWEKVYKSVRKPLLLKAAKILGINPKRYMIDSM